MPRRIGVIKNNRIARKRPDELHPLPHPQAAPAALVTRRARFQPDMIDAPQERRRLRLPRSRGRRRAERQGAGAQQHHPGAERIEWRARARRQRAHQRHRHALHVSRCRRHRRAGRRQLDTILIPKVGVPADVYMVDALVTQIEDAKGFRTRSASRCSSRRRSAWPTSRRSRPSRLEAMHFGVADYAAITARTDDIGGLNPDYPGDQWHSRSRA